MPFELERRKGSSNAPCFIGRLQPVLGRTKSVFGTLLSEEDEALDHIGSLASDLDLIRNIDPPGFIAFLTLVAVLIEGLSVLPGRIVWNIGKHAIQGRVVRRPAIEQDHTGVAGRRIEVFAALRDQKSRIELAWSHRRLLRKAMAADEFLGPISMPFLRCYGSW